jgi:hypothetical protein
MNLLLLLPLLWALSPADSTAQTHIPTTATTIASNTGIATASVSPSGIPNLIPPPSSIPSIQNNRSITVTNSCGYDIWPALMTASNIGPYTQGFYLDTQKSLQLWISHDWIGRIWARTNCSFNESTNTGPCFTGSCGNILNCTSSGEPPTTLAEFNMLGWMNLSYWDISLVNGFNLPMAIYPSPSGPKPICQWNPSPNGILDLCPQELVFYADAPVSWTEVAGCSSACDKYGDTKYCCTGNKGTADKCGPTRYSEAFKHVCPDAYTYAYDDKTSTFTTDTGPNWSYEIVFCPCMPYLEYAYGSRCFNGVSWHGGKTTAGRDYLGVGRIMYSLGMEWVLRICEYLQ